VTQPSTIAHTQREIDALLGKSTAENGKTEPRPWTLSRSLPPSKAQRLRLEGLHVRFARSLEVHFATVLQQPVVVAFAGVERVPAGELIASLDTPIAGFAVRLTGAEGTDGLFDLGADLALTLVERLLGGPGSGVVSRRALTSFEQALLRGVAERALTLLGESWSTVEPTRLECGAFCSDPALTGFDASESLLAAHFEIVIGSEHRDAVVALPIAMLGARVQELAAAPTADAGAWLTQQLRRANADVRVRFPEMRLTPRSLEALTAGQVLDTRHPSDAGFEIRVNGRLRFRGQIGQVRRHLGVRISEVANPAESDCVARPLEGRVL
jgi:flagellar motor switch protein FliM